MAKRVLFFLISVLVTIMIVGCAGQTKVAPEVMVGDDPHLIVHPSVAIGLPKNVTTIPYVSLEGNTAWIPPVRLENKKRWKGIVIHHTDSVYGCAAQVHEYHKSRGWDGLGYQFVINNGVFKNGYGKTDGLVEVGYRWRQQLIGSHCRDNGDSTNYWNEHTIGICLVGDFEKTRPTRRQMQSLAELVRFLRQRYNIPTSQIKGHGDIKATKCPGRYFSMSALKRML